MRAARIFGALWWMLAGACAPRGPGWAAGAADASDDTLPHAGAGEAPQGELPKDGAGLYDRYCKLCHGSEGRGYAADRANALTNESFLRTATNHFLYRAIEGGRPGTPMSAFGSELGGPLDAEAIRKIIEYLKSFQTAETLDVDQRVVQGDADTGKAIYREHCFRCHGEAGRGKTALSLDNPMFLATASDGFIRYAIEQGRAGTPMPAFGEKLAAFEIDGVTRLIRGWARNVDARKMGELPPSFEQIVINPKGPSPSLPPLREGRYVPADRVRKALARGQRMVLLDARPTSDWLMSHIPGSMPVPFYDGIDAIAKALPRDGTWIIAYCGCPHAASGKVMDLLRAEGFASTAVMDEGFFAWVERGYPLTFGTAPTGETKGDSHGPP